MLVGGHFAERVRRSQRLLHGQFYSVYVPLIIIIKICFFMTYRSSQSQLSFAVQRVLLLNCCFYRIICLQFVHTLTYIMHCLDRVFTVIRNDICTLFIPLYY